MNTKDHIILFDGICNLCNGAVQFVLKRDKKKLFKFTPLQSEAGKKLLPTFGLPQDHLKSFVFFDGEKVYTKSDAALKVAALLPYPTRMLSWFFIVPKFIRNFIYSIIAKNRYKIFGRKDACMVPTPEIRKRFL